MTYIALAFLCLTVLINIFFGLAVLLRVYQKPFGWYFVVTVLGVTLWALGDIGLLFARDQAVAHAFSLLFYIAPMITPISIWFFALTFPDNKPLHKALPFLAAIPLIAISYLFFADFNFFIKDIVITHGLNSPLPQKPGFYLYSAYFSLFFLLAYIAFFKKAKQLQGLNRTQEKYILYGVLFGSFLALLSNLTLPVSGITSFIWLGPFFSLIFPAAVTVAIVRHRLFNIRFVLARSIGYILTLASVAITFGILAFTVVSHFIFGESGVDAKQQIVYAILAASLAFTFNPVRKFFERGTNRLFYRDAYEPSAFIYELNRTIVENIELEPMLKQASKVISSNLKIEFCTFNIQDANGIQRVIGFQDRDHLKESLATIRALVSGAEERVLLVDTQDYASRHDKLTPILKQNNVGVLAQLLPPGKKRIGVLLLGNKKSGNPFTQGDLKIIEIVINELLISIQNALRFQEIQTFNATLQEKIETATKQLRHTNERLRILDQTKDDFISMASHQLRTPLTSVKGYVSMVLEGDAGKITRLQRKLLNQSFVSAQRMVYLIADLLNVSRLRTGKFVIENIPSNLADVVGQEMEQLIETAKNHKLTLTYHKPEHFPVLMLDETKIRQVIMNFIDNAIYYTPAGGEIDVYLEEKPQTIELRVRDNGMGVPKSEQPHLFSKFYRAHNAKRARPDGTGLGLFMAKKVIIAQGGALLFQSQEGKGSTFGFTFAKAKLLPPSTANKDAVPPHAPEKEKAVKK